MRFTLLLLFLIVGVCAVNGYGFGDREDKDRNRDDKDKGRCDENGKCDDKDIERCDENGNCDDRGCDSEGFCDDNDYDNERNLYEPCDYADDEDCVRKFYGKYGQCKVVYHEDNKPVYRQRYTSYLPKINLTIVSTKVRLRKLDGKIDRFYINKKSGNLVMSVDFTGIDFTTKLAYFIVHRRGREPAIARDFVNATFPVTLTAVIPIKDGITLEALKHSTVTAFIPVPTVPFFIGPGIAENKDPAIAASVAGLTADVSTALQEIFLTESPNFFLAYLQKYICDFGIPLSADLKVRAIYNTNKPLLYNHEQVEHH